MVITYTVAFELELFNISLKILLGHNEDLIATTLLYYIVIYKGFE